MTEVMQHAVDSYVYAQSHQDSRLMTTILQSLQDKYQLDHYPYHIECIDISHLAGDYTSAGISCIQ